MTTHENFLTNIENAAAGRCPWTARSLRNLVSVPLFHVTGCNSQLLRPVRGRHGGHHAVVRGRGVPAGDRGGGHRRGHAVPAIFWLALTQPDFADVDFTQGALGRPTAARRSRPTWWRGSKALPEGAGRQRLRPDRDVVACPRSCRTSTPTARRLGRLRRAGRRPRASTTVDPDGRRRAADPRAERRRRLLEQAGGDRRHVRRRLAAHRRPGPHRRGGPHLHRRPGEGHDQPRRRERVLRRGRERPGRARRASSRWRSSACPTR